MALRAGNGQEGSTLQTFYSDVVDPRPPLGGCRRLNQPQLQSGLCGFKANRKLAQMDPNLYLGLVIPPNVRALPPPPGEGVFSRGKQLARGVTNPRCLPGGGVLILGRGYNKVVGPKPQA